MTYACECSVAVLELSLYGLELSLSNEALIAAANSSSISVVSSLLISSKDALIAFASSNSSSAFSSGPFSSLRIKPSASRIESMQNAQYLASKSSCPSSHFHILTSWFALLIAARFSSVYGTFERCATPSQLLVQAMHKTYPGPTLLLDLILSRSAFAILYQWSVIFPFSVGRSVVGTKAGMKLFPLESLV